MPISDIACLETIISKIKHKAGNNKRVVVGIAGPPASGKSTLAAELVAMLNKLRPNTAAILPMDGFHLDNEVLKNLNLLDRKGSPPTFDFDGFKSLVERIRQPEKRVYVPVFDRTRDIAIAGASTVQPDTQIVVVEGNYLLLDQAPWDSLRPLFDYTVFIQTPVEELHKRLVQRWLDNGYDEPGAIKRAESNDIPNALLVAQNHLIADYMHDQSHQD